MEIRLKGLYGTSRKVDPDNRGRSYEIGFIKAGVNLTEDGLTLTITDKKLAQQLSELLKGEK